MSAMLVQTLNSCSCHIWLKIITGEYPCHVILQGAQPSSATPVFEGKTQRWKEDSPVRCGWAHALFPTALHHSTSCLLQRSEPSHRHISLGESAQEWCGLTERCRLGSREVMHSWRVILGRWMKQQGSAPWLIACWLGMEYWYVLKKREEGNTNLGTVWPSPVLRSQTSASELIPVCSMCRQWKEIEILREKFLMF